MADTASSPALQEQLNLLRRSYANRLPGRLQQAEELWRDLVAGEWNRETAENLHRQVHSLAGSGATFGYGELSDVARQLETLLRGALAAAEPPDDKVRGQASALLLQLRQAAERPATTAAGTITSDGAATPAPEFVNRSLFVLVDDARLAQDLAVQLGHFNFLVRLFSSPEALRTAARRAAPAAMILDIEDAEGGLREAALLASLAPDREAPVPVVLLGSRSDLQARLRAVRAGGDAYFTKPVDLNGLVDRLDVLTAQHTPEPLRVLIVDDEVSLANLYAFVLRQAGFSTQVLNDPLQVLQPLVEFRPDVVLTDINMPGCSGLELAAVIRQQEAYVSLPIVFMSTENVLAPEVAGVRLAGDDFLSKPIQPEHLVSSVTARALRARTLQSLMVRDNLTGLLNHTHTKEQLDVEISRARRTAGRLVFGLLNIDHFRSLNDQQGYVVGDRVLKGLARLLQQRLRRTDIVGRYGGDELAVILNGAEADAALTVVEDLRTRFAAIRHTGDGGRLTATLSAGLVALQPEVSRGELCEAASAALRQAKEAGRNRVVLA